MPKVVKRRVLSMVISRNEDNGVAEIVGAILLFAVVISLFTSFMVWYIPAQTASNEVHYELQTKSSLGSLMSALHTGVPAQGNVISQSIYLGIPGVSIFSSAQDTQFSLLPQYSGFNASLSFVVVINATDSGGTSSTHYFNETYRASGIMITNGNTEYISQISYVVEDGALLQYYGNTQPSDSLGPLPLGVVNNSGEYAVSAQMFNLSGQSETFSSSQSQIVNLQVNASNSFNYQNGSITSIAGNEYTISNMTLRSLSYTINSTLSGAWDYGFYSQFNSSVASYQNVINQTAWQFSGLPFSTYVSGNQFSISNNRPLNLSSISTEYLTLVGL